MSKQSSRTNGSMTKKVADDGDICPVCKSSRYLNPNMKFKVNPECYHKMCESCVDRLFSGGPANCPIAGCARTLRKAKFREQTFEDLKIEREVDIRRRVARAFDKREDDFETLRDYNDYLEQIEEVTWNLILRIDVEATENCLRRWEDYQKAESNMTAARRDLDSSSESGVPKKGVQRKAPNAAGFVQDGPKSQKKEDTGFSFQGLKKRAVPPRELPFDPWGGWSMAPQYYTVQEDYDVSWYAHQKKDTAYLAGGYDVKDFCNRTLQEAFGGFCVFIEDEIITRNVSSIDNGH
ncbi:TFIIH/NER complex subunit [Coniothyrium glycines]